MTTLEPFLIERYFARYETQARQILCASGCEALTLRELLALAPEAESMFFSLPLDYEESSGNLGLREAVAGLYTNVKAEEVLIHSGSSEGIYLHMQACLSPGDHVIVPWPCYQSLESVARAVGCQVSYWTADPAHGWAWDLDALRQLIRPATRLIVLNTPHNPTGSLMSSATFQAVMRIADQAGIHVFSDEIYRYLEYELTHRLPAACELLPQAVSLGGVSKAFGLAGLRIGWSVVRDAALRNQMAAIKDYLSISANTPGQFLCRLAIEHRETIWRRNRELLASNLSRLTDFMSRHARSFYWIPPRAGATAFIGWNAHDDLNDGCEGLCLRLLNQAGLLLLPGSCYRFPQPHFRIGFGKRSFPDALAVLEETLDVVLNQPWRAEEGVKA